MKINKFTAAPLSGGALTEDQAYDNITGSFVSEFTRIQSSLDKFMDKVASELRISHSAAQDQVLKSLIHYYRG